MQAPTASLSMDAYYHHTPLSLRSTATKQIAKILLPIYRLLSLVIETNARPMLMRISIPSSSNVVAMALPFFTSVFVFVPHHLLFFDFLIHFYVIQASSLFLCRFFISIFDTIYRKDLLIQMFQKPERKPSKLVWTLPDSVVSVRISVNQRQGRDLLSESKMVTRSFHLKAELA